MRIHLPLLAAVAISIPALSLAQGSATVQVMVTDPSGSSVPGASVTVSKPPAAPKSGKTDLQGVYVFQNLASGTYDVAVTAKGFAGFEVKQYEVTGGRLQTV